MGLRIKILTLWLQSFANVLFSRFYAFWTFRKMSFGVIPHITRVFFLIPWRFFPGSEFSWYKEHLTNVTQDVKITWKMEGLPYQWRKVAYSVAQERCGFPWKQFCKNFLVLVLGSKKNILGWSCTVAVHLVVVSERKHDFTFLKQPDDSHLACGVLLLILWIAFASSARKCREAWLSKSCQGETLEGLLAFDEVFTIGNFGRTTLFKLLPFCLINLCIVADFLWELLAFEAMFSSSQSKVLFTILLISPCCLPHVKCCFPVSISQDNRSFPVTSFSLILVCFTPLL